MFAKIVKNQYVGKSKIDFTFDGNPIDGKTLIGDIALPLESNGLPLSHIDTHFPDYFITGEVSDISTMELIVNKKEFKVLFITGIPKSAKRLDDYKLKGVTWSSYYEDRYRGYLFQITKSNTLIELENNSVKLNIISI